MAKSKKDSSEASVAKVAPKRQKATGASASRKAHPAGSGKAVEQVEGSGLDTASADVESSPSSDEIAKRAYEIYLRRGSRNGYDFDDWLEAERELRGRGTR